MAAKLKVFVTSDGLTEYAVATTSRPKALAAWGVHQDLFKQGAARESDDPALIKAANAQPGEVLTRAVGGSRAALKTLKAEPRKPKAGPSKAALKKVADLEAELEALDGDHEAEVAKIDRARADLDARAEREDAAYRAQREQLNGRLSAAQRALKD
jgi:hypothetical protein